MKKFSMLLLCMIIVFSSTLYIYGENLSGNTASTVFADTQGHWAEETINRFARQGLVHGVGNNCFEPDSDMTRCQFAALLHGALGLQIKYIRACDISEVYKDVSKEAWYAGKLYDLVTTGIVDEKIAFRAEGAITREEMTHYIIRAYEYKKGLIADTGTTALDMFSDKSELNPSYSSDARKAISLNILMGKGNNLLRPKAVSTRAEATVIVDRLITALLTSQHN